MSEKARDGQGRWRSKTIAFRISPEENQMLEDFVRLSGLTKQEYIIQRVLNREVVVYGNPRVHKALRQKMGELCEQIAHVQTLGEISYEVLSVLEFLGKIYEGLNIKK